MARQQPQRPFPEVRRFGRVDVDWPARPELRSAHEVAAHLVRHKVAQELRHQGIGARQLAEDLGGTERAWNSRLGGDRNLGLDELLAVAMLVPGLLERVLPAGSDLAQWFPPSYQELAVGAIGGPELPRFRTPGEVDWDTAARKVCDWWNEAVEDGSAPWTITVSVVLFEVLHILDALGLPRALAAPISRETPHPSTATSRSAYDNPAANISDNSAGELDGCTVVELEWTLRDAGFTLIWLDPFATPSADVVRAHTSSMAEALWDISPPVTADSRLVLIASSRQATAALNEVIHAGTRGGRESTLSIREARSLGHAHPERVHDAQVRRLGPAHGSLTWLRLKD
jgi:hypothetical protein